MADRKHQTKISGKWQDPPKDRPSKQRGVQPHEKTGRPPMRRPFPFGWSQRD